MVRRAVPTALTLGNLALGTTALLLGAENAVDAAALCILSGGVLDGLDGRVARLLRAESALGHELDSIADVVTFGAAPALLLYRTSLWALGTAGAIVAVLFALAAGYRLARFNVASPHGYFVGLPSTAAGALAASIVLAGARGPVPDLAALVLAALMVSHLRYRDFKRVDLRRLRRSKVFLAILVSAAVALIDPRKLLFLPLATYVIYGPKDALDELRRLRRRPSLGAQGGA